MGFIVEGVPKPQNLKEMHGLVAGNVSVLKLLKKKKSQHVNTFFPENKSSFLAASQSPCFKKKKNKICHFKWFQSLLEITYIYI